MNGDYCLTDSFLAATSLTGKHSGFNSNECIWQKLGNNKKDAFQVENFLRSIEDDYTSACAKYFLRNPLTDPVWMLMEKERKDLLGLIINSKSTIIPVLHGIYEIPLKKIPVNLFRLKKIHSIQGSKREVLLLEDVMKKSGRKISDFFDYDLMNLNREQVIGKSQRAHGTESSRAKFPEQREKRTENDDQRTNSRVICGIELRAPRLIDLDELAPLQAAYEHEEVQHRGSVFSPAASRINLANIITKGKILIALVNGRIVGKINVSGMSFNRFLVGGVFVHPDYRGQGIARIMTKEFINSLTTEGSGVTLFVKKTNIPARRLYTGLGFKMQGDYRITYFF